MPKKKKKEEVVEKPIEETLPSTKGAIKESIESAKEELSEGQKAALGVAQEKEDEAQKKMLAAMAKRQAEEAKADKSKEKAEKDLTKDLDVLHRENGAVSFRRKLMYYKYYAIDVARYTQNKTEEMAKRGVLVFDSQKACGDFINENKPAMQGFVVIRGIDIAQKTSNMRMWMAVRNAS